jgi:hypothetical protein
MADGNDCIAVQAVPLDDIYRGGSGGGGNRYYNNRSRRNSSPENFDYVNTPVYVNTPISSEIIARERLFASRLENKGFHIHAIEGDGNCLFRAVAHQMFNNEGCHEQIRDQCVNHMMLHRKRYEMFCDENFEEHIKEMRITGTWGDDLEIRALEEIFDRIICIYSSGIDNVDEPANKNFEEGNLLENIEPINLTYHGQSHYNSLCDERHSLPLKSRSTKVLLTSRSALFEEAMSPALQESTGNKSSLEEEGEEVENSRKHHRNQKFSPKPQKSNRSLV